MGKRQKSTRMVVKMERTEIGIGNMRIDVVDDNAVYINLNGWTYYIDDSTGEQILEKYKEKE
jgi:3-phenylpropionate/cinnamic acid dioxygenase small subunit